MNGPSVPTSATEEPFVVTSDTRLHGRWPLFARILWLILVLLTLAIFFASFPLYLTELTTLCVKNPCVYFQLTARQAQSLQGLGWSLGDYAALQIALWLVTIGVSLVVSTLIVWRRSQDRLALLVALMLVTFGPIAATSSPLGNSSLLNFANHTLLLLGSQLFVLVFLLFPSGQFVPRWTRWIPVVFLVAEAIPSGTLQIAGIYSGFLIFLSGAASVAVLQIYRYRRVSTPAERQQTKWVVFGFVVPITVLVIFVLLAFVPVLAEPGALYLPLAGSQATNLLTLCLVLGFGVAMLRYRLWDVDALINKALVYGLLTGLLGALYAGLIIGLESLAGLFGGQAASNPVVIVVSTLAIALLFLPTRRRIQAIIDRRFYRQKYDAEQVLAAFSATLRQETDLEQIRTQLLAVVQETMQPAHVSLWLRPVSQHEGHPAEAGAADMPILTSSTPASGSHAASESNLRGTETPPHDLLKHFAGS